MKWKGVIPALTTAFTDDLQVDHGFMTRHIRWLLDSGCSGIVALGSLGRRGNSFVRREEGNPA